MTSMTSTDVPMTVPMITDTPTKGINIMLLQEALARSRMREAQQAALEHRMARQLTAGRYWQRLAEWSTRRAQRARSAL